MNAPTVLTQAMTADATVPDGFRPVRIGGPFVAHTGPLFARIEDGRVQLGFRVEPRHTNPLGICHGGMLATFADMLIPCASMYHPGQEAGFLPTISLQVDYMGSAPLGSWVQGEGEVLRTTRNMLFGQAMVTCNGEPAMRVSGVFKQGPLITDGGKGDPLGVFDGLL
jgi:uncharacterized protein (TIGR00369 family)